MSSSSIGDAFLFGPVRYDHESLFGTLKETIGPVKNPKNGHKSL